MAELDLLYKNINFKNEKLYNEKNEKLYKQKILNNSQKKCKCKIFVKSVNIKNRKLTQKHRFRMSSQNP